MGVIYGKHPVHMSVQMCHKHNSYLMNEFDTDETLHSCSIQPEEVYEGG